MRKGPKEKKAEAKRQAEMQRAIDRQLKDADSGTKENPQDWYTVNGIRYIREDLVTAKADFFMERIAVAQEKQAAFYEKYDAMIAPLMKMADKAVREQIAKMKRKPFTFS